MRDEGVGEPDAGAGEPPVAPRRPVVHEAHGVRRSDDYAWLRDIDDPQVLGYLRAERDHYERAVAHLRSLRQSLADEMVSRTPAADSSVRWRRGALVYYTRARQGEEYDRLFRLDPSTDVSTLVLDPNALVAPGGHLGLGVVEPSPDGALVAYSVDGSGAEVFELRFRDVASGAELPDVVAATSFGGAWTADGTGFVYTVPDAANRPDRVRLHRLGTDPADDVTVLTEPDRRFELVVEGSRDGAWLVVMSASRDTTEVHLLDAADPLAPPRCVAARRPGVEYAVEPLPGGWDGTGTDRLLLVTDDGAPELTLVESPVPPPGGTGDPGQWREVPRAVLGRAERLESAAVLGRHVVLSLRRDGAPFLRVLDRSPGLDGRRRVREVHPALPCGQIRLWRAEDPSATYVVVVEENLVTAPVWVQVDLFTGGRQVLKRSPVPGVDPTRYVTRRLMARSADGTSVPVTIAHLRDAGPGSTRGWLLYGYGAYEACSWPEFDIATLSLLDRGLGYAVAHVRGGGERGRRWWQQGRLRAKQNTFDDFVAARDALVESGWAGERGVVSRGLSAGGLLQAAVFSQAPHRWRAVIAEVPFVDVVTTMSDPDLPLTVNEWQEWGDPIRSPEDFAAMLAYSPYDNPPPPGRPPLLVTGAMHDPRVLVHEPAKWVARLRATDHTEHPSPLLFRVELGAGAHAGPSGRLAHLHYEAEVAAWLLDQLGLADPPG